MKIMQGESFNDGERNVITVFKSTDQIPEANDDIEERIRQFGSVNVPKDVPLSDRTYHSKWFKRNFNMLSLAIRKPRKKYKPLLQSSLQKSPNLNIVRTKALIITINKSLRRTNNILTRRHNPNLLRLRSSSSVTSTKWQVSRIWVFSPNQKCVISHLKMPTVPPKYQYSPPSSRRLTSLSRTSLTYRAKFLKLKSYNGKKRASQRRSVIRKEGRTRSIHKLV